MNFDAGICLFEDSVPTIQRTIESIKDHVRYIFVVDGKWALKKSSSELSSPEVRDYLKSITNVICMDFPGHKEALTRQQYLNLAKEHESDALLWIDSDEWITEKTRWDFVKNTIKALTREPEPAIYCLKYEAKGNQSSHPRIWIHPDKIMFTEAHAFWKTDTGKILHYTADYPTIPSFVMATNDDLRSKKYIQETYDYQVELMKDELPFKEKYRKVMRNQEKHKYDIPGIPIS